MCLIVTATRLRDARGKCVPVQTQLHRTTVPGMWPHTNWSAIKLWFMNQQYKQKPIFCFVLAKNLCDAGRCNNLLQLCGHNLVSDRFQHAIARGSTTNGKTAQNRTGVSIVSIADEWPATEEATWRAHCVCGRLQTPTVFLSLSLVFSVRMQSHVVRREQVWRSRSAPSASPSCPANFVIILF